MKVNGSRIRKQSDGRVAAYCVSAELIIVGVLTAVEAGMERITSITRAHRTHLRAPCTGN